MNVTIINIKDLLKYTIGLIFVIFTVMIVMNFFSNKKNQDNQKSIEQNTEILTSRLFNRSFLFSIDTAIPIIAIQNRNENIVKDEKLGTKRILEVELAMMENINNTIKENNENMQEDDEKEKKLEIAKTGLSTEVILDKNLEASFTNTNGKVQVKNRTSYEITDELMQTDYSLNNNKDILIFHTHTCESYTPSEEYNYEMTGNYRTTDLNYSVARVGDKLTQHLTAYGYNVVHDKTYHDYPSYSGSYDRSYTTVTNILETNSEIQAIFDIHRDAVGNGNDYGPTVKIGDETVAQLMFVIGTDASGLLHPNWRQNFKFAAKIQEKANEMYPGLFRPINLSTSRYNQQIASGAVIIEVGATANTMEECLESMKYLAKVISEVMK